jgi:cell wall-associated NlpC family hydrolase
MPLDARRQAVIDAAMEWCGTPFLHATMIKGVGVDCVMLLAAAFAAAGVVPFVDPRPYPSGWHLHRNAELYINGLLRYGREIEQPAPGDVGVWKFGRCYSHGAILATPFRDDPNPFRREGEIIHALQLNGIVVRERLINGALLWRPLKWFSPY